MVKFSVNCWICICYNFISVWVLHRKHLITVSSQDHKINPVNKKKISFEITWNSSAVSKQFQLKVNCLFRKRAKVLKTYFLMIKWWIL